MREHAQNVLRDLLLEGLQMSAPDVDWQELLRQLPPHPQEWDGPLCQSALSLWRSAHPSGPVPPRFTPPLKEQRRAGRARQTERRRRRKAARIRRQQDIQAYLASVAERFREGVAGAVTPDGRILLEMVRDALPPGKLDGSTLPTVSLQEVGDALRRRGYAVWDGPDRVLLTPDEHRRREKIRTAERRAAEERFGLWCEAAARALDTQIETWLGGSGTAHAVLMEAAQATAPAQQRFVETWARRAGLVQWTAERDIYWGSREASLAFERQRSHVRWLRFLSGKASTPEATETAWRRLGLNGTPPEGEFYSPEGSLPVFLEKRALHGSGLVTLSDAGLHRTPKGVQAIAKLRETSGWYYAHYRPLFCAADLQPFSTQLLVRPETAAPVHVRPPHARTVQLHVGPTNSGKTYAALQVLAGAVSGAYLAPLRLLAWEAFERLNGAGCATRLLTGEESIETPGARVTAATIEMLPKGPYDVVAVDEAQLIGDPQRGWAWARALALTDTRRLEVCCAPEAEAFLVQLLRSWGDEVAVVHHERLVPLACEAQPMELRRLPKRSAVVAFSRTAVLRWKATIEAAFPDTTCAVIYGALPPDVRRAQTELVLTGAADFVVATDAIGMGLNLPLDHVSPKPRSSTVRSGGP